jgi:hypothetical protein
MSARAKAAKARRNRAYYARNRDARRAYHRAYYRRNRTKKLAAMRANYHAKRFDYSKHQKRYRQKHHLELKIAKAWGIPVDIVREMITNGESLPT